MVYHISIVFLTQVSTMSALVSTTMAIPQDGQDDILCKSSATWGIRRLCVPGKAYLLSGSTFSASLSYIPTRSISSERMEVYSRGEATATDRADPSLIVLKNLPIT